MKLSNQSFNRMESLLSQRDYNNLLDSVNNIYQSFEEDGFSQEDVILFIKEKLDMEFIGSTDRSYFQEF